MQEGRREARREHARRDLARREHLYERRRAPHAVDHGALEDHRRVLERAVLRGVRVEHDVEILLLAQERQALDAALERRPVVGADAVLAHTPHSGLGVEEERLVAGGMAGRAEEHHSVTERVVAPSEDDVARARAELPVAHEPRLLERMEVVPVVPLRLRSKQLRVGKSRGPRAVLGAEQAPEILRVEVIERDVVDVFGRDAEAEQLRFERLEGARGEIGEARSHRLDEAREERRGLRGLDVGRVEEQVREPPFAQELHEQAAVRQHHERRGREGGGPERVARGVGEGGEGQRADGEAARTRDEPLAQPLRGATHGAQLRSVPRDGPRLVEVGDAIDGEPGLHGAKFSTKGRERGCYWQCPRFTSSGVCRDAPETSATSGRR